MQRKLRLPLNALQTFEVLVRHERLSEAARELNITESAVSHQIKTLENWFGKNLFDRSRRVLRPSKDASRLAYVVEQSLMDIRDACDALLDRTSRNTLSVSCSAAFASIVLLPLLRRFHEQHPDIEIAIKLERYSDPATDADVFIRFADKANDETLESKLGAVGWQCIASRNMPEPIAKVKGKPESNSTVLLAERFDNPWNEFFQTTEMAQNVHDFQVQEFSEMNLVCAAAVSGEGHAIVPRLLARQLHRQGMVQLVSDTIIRTDSMYHYILPDETSANKRQLRNQFMTWLKKEVSETSE